MFKQAVWCLLGCAFSLSASSETESDAIVENEQPEISFYGQRSIGGVIAEPTQSHSFYRRVIAPQIKEENDDEINEEHNDLVELEHHHEPIKPLSRNEKLLAKKAQYYFERNRRDHTGLWDSVQGYPHTTMWDVASGIAATLALEALGLKTSEQTHLELEKTLATLNSMPLYKNWLPNREYSTKTGLPSGRLSQSESNGNGWSALDIGRLLIWLKILCQQHPELEPEIVKLIGHWKLDKAVHKGTLYGAKLYKGKEYYRQEGRHGYLQYAATGFEMFDYAVPLPDLNKYLTSVSINGSPLEIDTRNVPFMTSDPYILGSIEFGQKDEWNQLETIYNLHKQKAEQKDKLYSFAEDAMNKNPWFAYNNLFYYGKPWTSVSPSGKVIENPQILSHKVAFGFSVLFSDDYSEMLGQAVLENSLNSRSVPTGQYENGGSNTAFNINTNSLILVSLWYKSYGGQPILKPSPTDL